MPEACTESESIHERLDKLSSNVTRLCGRIDNLDKSQKGYNDSLQHHMDEEGELVKQILDQLSGHDEKFQNGMMVFQKLTVADDELGRRMNGIDRRLHGFESAIDKNATAIMKSDHKIERLTTAIEALARGLAPILEVMHNFTAAMPFFEMLGRFVTWVGKRFVVIAAVSATAWSLVNEPWEIIHDWWTK